MGFLKKLFGLETACPDCGTRGAKMASGGVVKCINPHCRWYDEAHARRTMPKDFSSPITVSYVNFRGEHKTFIADRGSIRARGVHLSMRVAPKGIRIALKRDKIVDRGSVEQALPEE